MAFHSESFSTFMVPLGSAAHQIAECFCQYHSNWQKAEQVYLNTLTVYAVNQYLNCLGYETDWENSDSYNVVNQALLDAADLIIKDYGKLECRRIFPDSEALYIPEEAMFDRLGYMAVSLNETLDQAEVLGFFRQVDTVEVPLSQLRSLDRFADYLEIYHLEQAKDVCQQICLSQWLRGVFTAGWQSLEEWIAVEPLELALQFRGSKPQPDQEAQLSTSITRTKVIQLGQSTQSILAMMTLKPDEVNHSVHIQVEVLPTREQTFLPVGLQLAILDDQQEEVMEAQTRETQDGIRLEFTAEVNDRFGLRILFDSVTIIENFLV
ncbi:MAG: DUF1822 family protein [Oculatellaceae cyanobacterium Prado106]|jgi:hypothetical protein|nr:DUF1822 family protein [Oculatellaceae cyanobacterium Prado106]